MRENKDTPDLQPPQLPPCRRFRRLVFMIIQLINEPTAAAQTKIHSVNKKISALNKIHYKASNKTLNPPNRMINFTQWICELDG